MTSSTADATGGDVADFFAGNDTGDDPSGDTGQQHQDPADDDASEGDEPDDDDDEPLGPKGTKALDAEKVKRRAEAEKRRTAEAKIRELQAKLDGQGGDDADKAARAAETAALAKANARILRSEIRAAAAGKLHDPKDALVHLDLNGFEVDDDGTVDEDELSEAIADLLDKKPYLAAQGGSSKTPRPDRSQGARGSGVASTAAQFAAATEKLLN